MDNARSGQRGHNASTTSIRSIHASMGAGSIGGAYGTPAEAANGACSACFAGLMPGVDKEFIQKGFAVEQRKVPADFLHVEGMEKRARVNSHLKR